VREYWKALYIEALCRAEAGKKKAKTMKFGGEGDPDFLAGRNWPSKELRELMLQLHLSFVHNHQSHHAALSSRLLEHSFALILRRLAPNLANLVLGCFQVVHLKFVPCLGKHLPVHQA